jgi:hypothetical protein
MGLICIVIVNMNMRGPRPYSAIECGVKLEPRYLSLPHTGAVPVVLGKPPTPQVGGQFT